MLKLTEFFAEQVLTGLLVLAIVVLPYLRAPNPDLDTALEIVGTGVGIIIVAYFLGMIFDRFADTILSRPEQYHRLKYAVERRDIARKKTDKGYDWYPVDQVRAKLLITCGGAIDHVEYLRTRIRLTRSLTVFLPAITVSALMALGSPCPMGLIVPGCLTVVAALYAYTFIVTLKVRKRKGWELGRTDQGDLDANLGNFHGSGEPASLLAMFLGVLAIALIVYFAVIEPVSLKTSIPVFAAGGILSYLSGWSWWRISKTFMHFLIACNDTGMLVPASDSSKEAEGPDTEVKSPPEK
jgi:hypothetical protein